MRIVGMGSEIVECVRIREMIDRHGELFLRRAYTDGELSLCQSSRHCTELFAERWAAKEAAMKCLNVRSAERTDVEVRMDVYDRPRLVLHAAVRSRAAVLGVAEIFVTVAHCREYATATAIALG